MANYSFQKNCGGSVFTFFEFEGNDEEAADLEDENES
jgi:hypothetical protein